MLCGHATTLIYTGLLLASTFTSDSAASQLSDQLSCDVGERLCTAGGLCVKIHQFCDGVFDCTDHSDELGCEYSDADSNEATDDAEETSDEGNTSNESSCSRSQFPCSPGVCIPESWVCDGDPDCQHGVDEMNCGEDEGKCDVGEFRCASGTCLPLAWRCDGDNDCGDASDELCSSTRTCAEDEFACDNGRCVAQRWICDGEDDCQDNTDELNCDCASDTQFLCAESHECIDIALRCNGQKDCRDWSDENNCNSTQCREGEFSCVVSGVCILSSWVCDGDSDCADSSDEQHCPEKQCNPETQFQCMVGNCVHLSWRCDGEADCSDNSDELNCDEDDECLSGQIRCLNSDKCITQQQVCDGTDDCGDMSDESQCADRPADCTVDNGGCSHICHSSNPNSQSDATSVMTSSHRSVTSYCRCLAGYVLASDGRTCIDYDECEHNDTCSQMCVNTEGSYVCQCAEGYRLRDDGAGCVALDGDMYLLFTNRVDIRKIMPNRAEYTPILRGLTNAIALDYHHASSLVYWTDVTDDHIKRAYLNGTGIQSIVTTGLENPSGIAVDWIHDKLFWTDSGTARIEVANLDGSHRSVIVSHDLGKPRALVAHPSLGMIFWTDWGDSPRIERSSMDGKDRRTLVDTSLFWPNGLTVDYAGDKLYWTDAKHHVIECANLDGSARTTVISQGLPHPFAITMFEDDIYWTDWHTKTINKADKKHGENPETVKSKLYYPMDILTAHQLRQPEGRNRCIKENGGCSHLCLPNILSYSCACPSGFKLLPDGATCAQNVRNLMLFSTLKDIRRISFDTSDHSDVVIDLHDVKSAVALEWDHRSDYLYWSDVTLETINRARWDGSGQEVLIDTSLDSPAGLAIDWVTDKLYWTDAEFDRIEVSNLDGSMRTVLIWEDLDRPRDIIVDPIRGYMYWSDWGEQPKIEKAGMDGRGRHAIVTANLTWPNGLAIDYSANRLYWVDAGMHTLEYADLNGDFRKILIADNMPHPFGLTIHEDQVYWTDWRTRSIQYADKVTGGNRGTLRENLDKLMDVHMFHRTRPDVSSMCHIDNGGCSHVCVLSAAPRTHSCLCPTGLVLNSDGRNCNTAMDNFLIFANRRDIRAISLDVPYYADIQLYTGNLTNAAAVGVDSVEGYMYWSDTVLDTICRARLDGSGYEELIRTGLDTTDGLAVDVIGRKLYWTDSGSGRIEVAQLDGSNRKVLVYEELENPRAIDVHHYAGYMFWSDWGREPRIERADMDGNNRLVIVRHNLGWPNGLAVDVQTSRIYWADAKTELIESADLNGHNRRVVVSAVPHPYGLTVSADRVYWTDWKTKSIHTADKVDGSSQRVIREDSSGLMDIQAVHMATHGVSRCGSNNGGCSDLCLPNPQGFTCSCPTGITLTSDGTTCKQYPDKYLLFASQCCIRRISLDTVDHTDVYLPLHDLHNAIALDYDLNQHKIYYTDLFKDVIRSANMDGSDMKTLVSSDITTADGIAVDWIAKNLYWTDAGRDVITVARLHDGSAKKTVVSEGLDEPRAITLFPRKGYLFWSDWGKNPRIEKSYLDGSFRKAIIETNLRWPNGLCVDYEGRRLYWADAQLDRIESSDLNGRNRVVLVNNVPHPFGLTMDEQYLYWTDWQLQSIERVDKMTGRGQTTIQHNMAGLMDVHIVSEHRQQGSNLCAHNNGNCTHLCLALGPESYVCACPDYPDHTTCSTVPGSSKPHTGYGGVRTLMKEFEGKVKVACTKLQIEQGNCSPNVTFKAKDFHSVYIALAIIIILILTAVLVVILIWNRRKRQGYNVETSLTFTNPTYHRSSSEQLALDRKILASPTELKPWRMFKYEKNQERLAMLTPVEEKINNQEAASLLKQKEHSNINTEQTVTSIRHESKNIFVPGQTKRWNKSAANTKYDAIETNI